MSWIDDYGPSCLILIEYNSIQYDINLDGGYTEYCLSAGLCDNDDCSCAGQWVRDCNCNCLGPSQSEFYWNTVCGCTNMNDPCYKYCDYPYEGTYCYEPTQECIIYGCIDQIANNYDPLANTDDGSCEYSGSGMVESIDRRWKFIIGNESENPTINTFIENNCQPYICEQLPSYPYITDSSNVYFINLVTQNNQIITDDSTGVFAFVNNELRGVGFMSNKLYDLMEFPSDEDKYIYLDVKWNQGLPGTYDSTDLGQDIEFYIYTNGSIYNVNTIIDPSNTDINDSVLQLPQ
jgi:hypothetical protein